MAMMPTYGLQNLVAILERDGERYPFYGILLYTPINGLDGRLHHYVTSRWSMLNSLTGDSCLVVALEDIDRGVSIDAFKPEEVYDIARLLGATVSSIPCMVLFTDPQHRNDCFVLKLREVFPDSTALTDEALTTFFRSLQSILDDCSRSEAAARIACLKGKLAQALRLESAELTSASTATTSTTFQAIKAIVETHDQFGPTAAPIGEARLRRVLTDEFNRQELEVLCADVTERLAERGVDLELRLDIVGGDGMQENQVLNLIRFLRTRGHLQVLIDAARAMKPGML